MVTVWLKGESEASTVCFTAIGGTWEVGYSNFHSSCVWSVGLVCFCRHSCFAGLSRVVFSRDKAVGVYGQFPLYSFSDLWARLGCSRAAYSS